METYAADVIALTDGLDLKGAIHVGHSTSGGEVAHHVARAKQGRASKAVLIGAVPPVMVKSEKNPMGAPISVFDGIRARLLANRAQLSGATRTDVRGPHRFGQRSRLGCGGGDRTVRVWSGT
jgi:non-heme chloroperoxidase